MRRLRFHLSVLSQDVKFIIGLTLLSLAFGLLCMWVAYLLGFGIVPELVFFTVAAVLVYLVIGSIGLIRRSKAQRPSDVII